MKCFYIEPTHQTRSIQYRGPAATPILERLYICKETGYVRWEEDHIPGYNFGPGAMFFEEVWKELHLMLMFQQGHYIDIDGPVSTCKWLLKGTQHKCRTRVGSPPNVTVHHNCESTSMIWTLENGMFEAEKWKSESSLPGIQ